ncbi:MAG TPA: hypothetical protein VN030_14965 [Cellvibrio sp.]|nr:hypothetical protein [Cellvibrio sp.]
MKYRYLFIALALSLCANANADWFLRGTHNAWVATPMVSGGTNSMQLDGVVFTTAGSLKFDRFGDWKESYGVGGLGGSNIPVAAGTWNIKFFTNTKTWSITAPPVAAAYHVRGTFNSWLEGTLMARVGTTDVYETCINFTGGDANGGPRFKIDPNGGWGDAMPSSDLVVTAGWVKVSFNSSSKAIATQQNLAANCGVAISSAAASSVVVSSSSAQSSLAVSSSSLKISSSVVPASSSSKISSLAAVSSSSKSSLASSVAASSAPSSIYHVRGTFNSWLEGTLMSRIGTTDSYEKCVNFAGGDGNGGPRFKIDPSGGWGDAIPAADFAVTAGWVKITFNSVTKAISVQQNLAANCAIASSSLASSALSSAPASIYHVRGTFNGWVEGTLMTRIGTGDSYEKCVNFVAGDANGSPRFKIDPNGGWGDAIPAADFIVAAGWVKITFNSSTKAISVQQNLAANCAAASSLPASSVAASSATSAPASIYHVRGTFNGWLEGTLMTRVGNTDIYEKCIKFPADPQGARFKIDPNGSWGSDVLPSGPDVGVAAGWVKITLNSTTKTISLQQNLSTDCRPLDTRGITHFTPEYPDIYLRSSIDNWGPGLLMHMFFEDASLHRSLCVPTVGTVQFRVVARDRNGEEGFDLLQDRSLQNHVTPIHTFTDMTGHSLVEFSLLKSWITPADNRDPTCGNPEHNPLYHTAFPTVPQPSKPFIPVHVRGTHNGWAEGLLMTQLGTTDDYESCVNIPAGDANGGPRFQIDPSGGWLDETPVANVPAGWVRIRYNATTRKVMKRAYLTADCTIPVYSLTGTHFTWSWGWKPGDFFEYVDGDTPEWKICRNFTQGDRAGAPRLHISRGFESPLPDETTSSEWASRHIYPVNGWTYVSFTNDHLSPTILTNLGPNCTLP